MSFSLRFALLAGFALVSACTTSTPVRGKSDGLVIPELRGHVDFIDRGRYDSFVTSDDRSMNGGERRQRRGEPRRGETSRRRRARHRGRGAAGFEFALGGTSNDFRPSNGFARSDFTIVDTHVAFRGGGVVDDRLAIEAIAGVGFNHFEVETGPVGGARDDDVTNSFGPLFGLQLTLDIVDELSVFGRATKGFGFGADIESEKLELGLSFGLSEATRLFAVYREWDFEDDSLRFVTGSIDLSLELTGVVFGIETRF